MAAVPTQIDVGTYADACKAFCEVLGIPSEAVYFPVVLAANEIHLSMVPTDKDGTYAGRFPKGVPADMSHPQGDEAGELSCAVTIKVDA